MFKLLFWYSSFKSTIFFCRTQAVEFYPLMLWKNVDFSLLDNKLLFYLIDNLIYMCVCIYVQVYSYIRSRFQGLLWFINKGIALQTGFWIVFSLHFYEDALASILYCFSLWFCFYLFIYDIAGVSRREDESAFLTFETGWHYRSERVNITCKELFNNLPFYLLCTGHIFFLQAHWKAQVYSKYEETNWHGKSRVSRKIKPEFLCQL